MIGIFIQLTLSWVIVKFYQKESLEVIGIRPSKKRALAFFIFLLITALFAASGILLRMYFGKEVWQMNPEFSTGLLLNGLWWNIKSVLFEELIFRGVLFYILFKKWGAVKAVLISSVVFGMFHWSSYNVWGNAGQMLWVLLLTGAAGVLYAYAYLQTGSIYTPVAMHLGWNFTRLFIFSEGLIGNGWLIMTKQPQVTVSYPIYWMILLLPYAGFFVVNYLLLQSRYFSTEKLQ